MNTYTEINTLLKNINFCALDLETTGPDPLIDRIVEVGIVRFSLDSDLSEFSTLINPKRRINPDAVKIHGITMEMTAESPYIEDVLDDISDFIKDSVLVIQNPPFDLTFLEAVYNRLGTMPDNLQAFDTVRLSRRVFPDLNNHKLATVAHHIGMDFSPHRALSDARACMNIFRSIIRHLDNKKGLMTLEDLLHSHGPMSCSSWKRFSSSRNNRYSKLNIGHEVRIRYIDYAGIETERTIIPREFIKYGRSFYISAFCDLRGDIRYFRTDRIRFPEKAATISCSGS